MKESLQRLRNVKNNTAYEIGRLPTIGSERIRNEICSGFGKRLEEAIAPIEAEMQELSSIEEELGIDFVTLSKIAKIIKRYTYSGGWSGDYTTRYWDMGAKELSLVAKLFEDNPIIPLSKS